ncbi:MAG: DUF423 domain-containing protein [Proteobacteria bacterium]|nr:DUF423 domain-containing protein [Pseudomonadota bacterium]
MIRALLLAAGLSGAAGVALSAAAAHVTGGATLATAGQFLLFHAPAFLALAALAKADALPRRFIILGAGLLAVGLVLFAGDLSVRVFFRFPLFPNAAPGGGILLISGWMMIALAGVFFARR